MQQAIYYIHDLSDILSSQQKQAATKSVAAPVCNPQPTKVNFNVNQQAAVF